MPRRRITPGSKILVVLVCCFMGAWMTHILLTIVQTDTATKQNQVEETPADKHDTEVKKSEQTPVTSLVAISLPPPPPAHTAISSTSVPTKPASVSAPRDMPRDQPSEVTGNFEHTTIQKTQASAINTQNETLIQQGLSLLNNTEQKVPQVLIRFPEAPQLREQVINTLRACMGVTLGKVNDRGEVLAQENATVPFSPFLRLVEGKLSRQEQMLAQQWQSMPGNIVRFYPQTADAKVLGGLLQLVQGALADKQISGEYRIEQGGLNLVNININGNEQATKLRLSEKC